MWCYPLALKDLAHAGQIECPISKKLLGFMRLIMVV
jgi:hypothetical protein